LNGEIFYTLKEAKVIIEGWRQHYSTVRPYSSLNYKPPAPEATVWPRRCACAPAGGAAPRRDRRTDRLRPVAHPARFRKSRRRL
ncbi:MAG: integrase core domain-containing protein, partial [Shinella sp.]|uniref:integrase core domain-containing protein n=1 Tax=Shinella sp. TaxID=1870904 RepID=UPI004036BB4B